MVTVLLVIKYHHKLMKKIHTEMCPRTTYDHRPDQLRSAVGMAREILAEHTILKLKL